MVFLNIKMSAGREEIDREISLQEGMTYYDLLDTFGVNPETVVVTCSGVPVPFDDTVAPGDIRIVRVVSSG